MTLDIQGAYNTIWTNGLLVELSKLGVDEYLICWVQSYLEGKISLLEVGDSHVEIVTQCGVP